MDSALEHTLEYGQIKNILTQFAVTVRGKELAQNLAPVDDFRKATDSLNRTAEAMQVLAWANPPLGGIFDLRDKLKKVKLGAVLDTAELTDILSTMWSMRAVKKFFRQDLNEAEDYAPWLKNLAKEIEILGQQEQDLANSLDMHGNLRDDASPELKRLRRDLRATSGKIKDKMNAIVKNSDNQKFFQEAIVTMRDERYVVPVKQEYRYHFPGIIHDQSASGATLFIEPLAVAELNNDVKQLSLAEKQEIERILRRLTAAIGKVLPSLEQNLDILAQIDFVFAKAKMAQSMNATKPLLNDAGRTNLKAARHPLIPPEQVVPIDLSVGEKYRMLLVTGPNTGGKTVCMKTMGLLVLMAQSGCFIPVAAGSELAMYRKVYADIGDEQSIEQNLSTFSAHMTHVISILTRVTAQDLLLLDEVGAGTDPAEGAALARAILEKLSDIGATVIATTHYTDLKTFAFNHPGVENACVEFDVQTLKPTYRLLIGLPGSSNAFAISRRLGLAEDIIARAEQVMDADHADFEQVVSELEREKIRYEQMNADIRERQRQAADMEAKAAALQKKLSEEKGEIIRRAKEQSAAMVRRTKRETETIIKELKAQFDDHGKRERQQAIEAARRELNVAADRVAPNLAGQKIQGKRLDMGKVRPGDVVYVTTLGQRGTVLAVKGDELELELGTLRMTAEAKSCRFLGHEQNQNDQTAPNVGTARLNLHKTANVSREIDIRGLMVDEAESVMGKFLDDAVIGGLGQVLIIHGKGTGALRKGVHAYLSQHKNVADYNFADIDEGGTGATVVSLK